MHWTSVGQYTEKLIQSSGNRMSFRVQGLYDRPENRLKGHKYRGTHGVHILAYS